MNNFNKTPLALIPIIVIAAVFAIYLGLSFPIQSSSTRNTTTTTTSSTKATHFSTSTNASISDWEFAVSIVNANGNATVNYNLSYTGDSNGSFELGVPVAVTVVKDQNNSPVWSTVSTALLRLVNVTYGQSFTYSDTVPAGVLLPGVNYTFVVRPQLNSNTGMYLGNQLQLIFTVTGLGQTSNSTVISASTKSNITETYVTTIEITSIYSTSNTTYTRVETIPIYNYGGTTTSKTS